MTDEMQDPHIDPMYEGDAVINSYKEELSPYQARALQRLLFFAVYGPWSETHRDAARSLLLEIEVGA